MYESFFGLSRRPFPAAPDPQCLHDTLALREVRTAVRRSVEEGRGITLVTAAAGLGKSLFCRVLLQDLRADWTVFLLDRSSLRSRRGLLHAILEAVTDAGPVQHAKELELRLHTHFAIRQGNFRGGGIVVIVDEAETAHPETLDELAALANTGNHPPLLRVVLAGRPEIIHTISRPDCSAIAQCLAARYELKPLTLEDSRAYIQERIRQAGRPVGSVFTDEALTFAARAGGGNPRSINQLCDHSLLLAYISDDKPLKAALVRDALHDLQSLPAQIQAGPFLTGPAPPVSEPNPSLPRPPLPAEPQNRHPDSTVAPRLAEPAVIYPAEDSSLTSSTSSPNATAGLPPTETGVYEVGAGIPSKNASPWFHLLSRPPEPAASPAQSPVPPTVRRELPGIPASDFAHGPVRGSGVPGELVLDRYARLEAGLPIPAGCPRSVQPAGMPREFHPTAWQVGPLTRWERWQRLPDEELISDPWVSQPLLTPRVDPIRKPIIASSAAATEKPERLRVFTTDSDHASPEAADDDPTRYLLLNLPSEQFYRGQRSAETAIREELLGNPLQPDQLLEGLIPLVDQIARDYEPATMLPTMPPMLEPEPPVGEPASLLEEPLPETPLGTQAPSPPERKRGRFSQLFTRLRQRAFGQE